MGLDIFSKILIYFYENHSEFLIKHILTFLSINRKSIISAKLPAGMTLSRDKSYFICVSLETKIVASIFDRLDWQVRLDLNHLDIFTTFS